MSRLAIAFALALVATGTNAQNAKSGQSDTPAVAGANGTRPFLFDGRMSGDGGVRQGALTDDHHPNAGAIVMPPKADQQRRER
jgi:L-serine deaminase